MPKLKTNSGAAKRFKKTGSGHFKHKQSFTSHILTKKAPKRKRHLRDRILVDKTDEARLHQLLPNV